MLSDAVPGAQPRIGPVFGADADTAIPDGDVHELERDASNGGGFPDVLGDPRLQAGPPLRRGEFHIRGETGRAGCIAAVPRGEEQGRGEKDEDGEVPGKTTVGLGPGHVRFRPRRVQGNGSQATCPAEGEGSADLKVLRIENLGKTGLA